MDTLRIRAIRGAVCVQNTADSIQESLRVLFNTIFAKNNIDEEHIVSIVFSVTDDITAINPASALRKAGFAHECALFCCAEPRFDGSLASVIRVLITYYSDKEAVHVYLNGAEVLRPDRAGSII